MFRRLKWCSLDILLKGQTFKFSLVCLRQLQPHPEILCAVFLSPELCVASLLTVPLLSQTENLSTLCFLELAIGPPQLWRKSRSTFILEEYHRWKAKRDEKQGRVGWSGETLWPCSLQLCPPCVMYLYGALPPPPSFPWFIALSYTWCHSMCLFIHYRLLLHEKLHSSLLIYSFAFPSFGFLWSIAVQKHEMENSRCKL